MGCSAGSTWSDGFTETDCVQSCGPVLADTDGEFAKWEHRTVPRWLHISSMMSPPCETQLKLSWYRNVEVMRQDCCAIVKTAPVKMALGRNGWLKDVWWTDGQTAGRQIDKQTGNRDGRQADEWGGRIMLTVVCHLLIKEILMIVWCCS